MDGLDQQYGGRHSGAWVDKLPPSWVPFVQLARLSPPTGIFLVLFPHLFGMINAVLLQRVPATQILQSSVVLGAGSFFLSNTIHGWNDLIDAPIDKLVTRTKDRPIVRGSVSPFAAFLFTASQALAAATLLLLLPTTAVRAATPGIVAHLYYPFAKRHTHLTQFLLGVALAWGIVIGTAAMAIVPWRDEAFAPTAHLFLASTLWTVIYDTVYAFQDVCDDVKIGMGSTAVLFGARAKPFLWTCLGGLLGALILYGRNRDLGPSYYVIAVGGCLTSLGAMIDRVDLQASQSCWWWFGHGFWFAGSSIAGGMLSQVFLA